MRKYKFLMALGRVIPSSAAQVKAWIKCGCKLDMLGEEEVEQINSIMEEFGFVAQYKLTKSKSWSRLINKTDLLQALKTKYGVKSSINTVDEAVAAKKAREINAQKEHLRVWYSPGRQSQKVDSLEWDSEFGVGIENKLTENDVRDALNLPENAQVTFGFGFVQITQ